MRPVGVGPGTAGPRQGRWARREGRAAGSGQLPRGRATPAVRSLARSGWSAPRLLRGDRLPSEVDPAGGATETRSPTRRGRRKLASGGDARRLEGGCGRTALGNALDPLLLHRPNSATRRRPKYGVNNNAADSNPAAPGRLRTRGGPGRAHPSAFWDLWGFAKGWNPPERRLKSQKLRLPSFKARGPEFRVEI